MMCAKPRVREDWEKRDDARTLARAEEIKADKERLADAQKAAREIANEEIARVKGIMKIAGKSVPKAPEVEEPKQQQVYGQKVIPNTVVTPQFAPRRHNPATIGRL